MNKNKALFSIAFSLFLMQGKAKAQCPTPNQWGEIYLTTQTEVDAFLVNYPNCTVLSGSMIIGDEDLSGIPTDITDLTPLSNLTSIGGYLGIYSTQITSLSGLENLNDVGEMHIMENHQLLSLSGLENIATISQALAIYNNNQLSSLTNFTNLTSLSDLQFADNPLLTSLTGLEGLTNVGAIGIWGNNQLTDLSALQNINPSTFYEGEDGGGIGLSDNPLLSICNLTNFCTYLQGTGHRYIANNTGDCVNEQAVLNACASSISDNKLSKISIYPNPIKDILYLDAEVHKVIVTNVLGKEIFIKINLQQIDMSTIESGIYFVTIKNKNGAQATKMIVKADY